MSSRDVAYDNKDPSWNGDLAGWPTYVRKVRFHYEQTPKSKRKLLGPRLASKLTHKAWDILQSIDHEELRRPNGAKYLLLYLRERLGKTPVPDAGQKLEELFLRLRRAPGSSMATWAAQVREAYRGVQRALARTRQQEPQAERRTQQTSTTGFAPPGRPRSGATASEPQQEPASPQAATARESMSPPRLERISPEDDPHEEYHSGAEEPGGMSSGPMAIGRGVVGTGMHKDGTTRLGRSGTATQKMKPIFKMSWIGQTWRWMTRRSSLRRCLAGSCFEGQGFLLLRGFLSRPRLEIHYVLLIWKGPSVTKRRSSWLLKPPDSNRDLIRDAPTGLRRTTNGL